jgi:integrase
MADSSRLQKSQYSRKLQRIGSGARRIGAPRTFLTFARASINTWFLSSERGAWTRSGLRNQGYAPTTINQILRIASSVFRLAIKHGRCATNPLDRVDRACKPAREITAENCHDDDAVGPDNILDPTEIRRLLEAANPGFDRTLFLTAFVTGAREGELFAAIA